VKDGKLWLTIKLKVANFLWQDQTFCKGKRWAEILNTITKLIYMTEELEKQLKS